MLWKSYLLMLELNYYPQIVKWLLRTWLKISLNLLWENVIGKEHALKKYDQFALNTKVKIIWEPVLYGRD